MWLLHETVAVSVARLRSVCRRAHSIELATRCKQLHFVNWLYNNLSILRGSKIEIFWGEEKSDWV